MRQVKKMCTSLLHDPGYGLYNSLCSSHNFLAEFKVHPKHQNAMGTISKWLLNKTTWLAMSKIDQSKYLCDLYIAIMIQYDKIESINSIILEYEKNATKITKNN